MLNNPANVANASNKLKAFQVLSEAGVSIPEFTTDPEIAQRWYLDGTTVIGRCQLQGHSGQGILLTDPLNYPQSEGGMDVVGMREFHGRIPLYVKYVKKRAEYRVHVFSGVAVDVQQKRKRNDTETDSRIRSFNNGWVYCRDNINPYNAAILDQSIAAVEALGLDFGAVDVIWNDHYQRAYVLEVNTAPGLIGTTLTTYTDAIRGLL